MARISPFWRFGHSIDVGERMYFRIRIFYFSVKKSSRKAAPVTLDSLIIAEATAGKEVLLKAAALALTAYVNVSDYLKEYVMEQFNCLALEVVRKGPGRQEEIPSALFRDGEEAKLLVEALG